MVGVQQCEVANEDPHPDQPYDSGTRSRGCAGVHEQLLQEQPSFMVRAALQREASRKG
jgi:hypothetical protein